MMRVERELAIVTIYYQSVMGERCISITDGEAEDLLGQLTKVLIEGDNND